MNGGNATFEDSPLWPEGAPDWALDATLRLFAALPSDQDWDVWRTWYEERLQGGSRGESHEIVFATIPDSEWKKGAATANRWIADHLPRPPIQTRQRPALHQFHETNGLIVLAPNPPADTDAATTQDLMEAFRRRISDLRERLKTMQADPRLLGTLDALEAQLPASLAGVRVGFLADAYLALEADCEAYDSPQGREQHALDAIAALLSLKKSARTIVGRFKEGRKILAEQAEIDLTTKPGALETAEAESGATADLAAEHPEQVDPPASAALRDPEPSIARSRDRSERGRHVAMRLLSLLNFLNALAALVGKSAKFAAGAGERAASEIGGVTGDSWKEIRKQVPPKIGEAVAEMVRKPVKTGLKAAAVGAALWNHSALLGGAADSAERIAAALGPKGQEFKEISEFLRHHVEPRPPGATPQPPAPADPKPPTPV